MTHTRPRCWRLQPPAANGVTVLARCHAVRHASAPMCHESVTVGRKSSHAYPRVK
jgi:hypothetical protein